VGNHDETPNDLSPKREDFLPVFSFIVALLLRDRGNPTTTRKISVSMSISKIRSRSQVVYFNVILLKSYRIYEKIDVCVCFVKYYLKIHKLF
jgi:hypothetical protein